MAENARTNGVIQVLTSGLETMMGMQRPTFTAMAEVNTKLYESLAAANREWVSFLNRSLKDDLAVPQQLAQCRSLQDIYRVYAQILQNACSHYQAGLTQMATFSQSITENALKTLQSDSEGGTKH